MAKKWFEETLYQNDDANIGYKQCLLNCETIVETSSEFQKIIIFKNPKFGKVLALDGVIQTTENDEFFYHEMFVHVPIISHGAINTVLIIGGGDGGILREILKHKSIATVKMIEIDGKVVELCQKEMPALSDGAFNDSKVTVMIDDGINFVKTTEEKFDLIIVDSTDPINVGETLFTTDFYQHAKRCLNQGGILATQSGVVFLQKEELQNIHHKLDKIFKQVSFFVVPVPTYIGSFMCLSFVTDDTTLIPNLDSKVEIFQNRLQSSKISNLKYYNPQIHIASFMLPEFIKNSID